MIRKGPSKDELRRGRRLSWVWMGLDDEFVSLRTPQQSQPISSSLSFLIGSGGGGGKAYVDVGHLGELARHRVLDDGCRILLLLPQRGGGGAEGGCSEGMGGSRGESFPTEDGAKEGASCWSGHGDGGMRR
jgi:hypothetical protein